MGASPDYFTTRQAADFIGVSPSTLARWAAHDRIPFTRGPAGERLFRREDLEAIVIRLESEPPEAEE